MMPPTPRCQWLCKLSRLHKTVRQCYEEMLGYRTLAPACLCKVVCGGTVEDVTAELGKCVARGGGGLGQLDAMTIMQPFPSKAEPLCT